MKIEKSDVEDINIVKLSPAGAAIMNHVLEVDNAHQKDVDYEMGWGSNIFGFLHILSVSDGLDYYEALDLFYVLKESNTTAVPSSLPL